MAKIATYTGLVLLAFAGSALDSQGMAGYIAIAGVLAGFGLIRLGMKLEEGVNLGKPVCQMRKEA